MFHGDLSSKGAPGQEARGLQVGQEVREYCVGHVESLGVHTERVATTVAWLKLVTKHPETGKAKRIPSGSLRGTWHGRESLANLTSDYQRH